jgi:hypothetical protein
MPAKRKSAKAALASSYAGGIVIALLLAAGLGGFVMAVRDPIDALVRAGLNFFLRQAPGISVRMHGPTPSAFLFVFLAVMAVLLFGCGLWLGSWLYPKGTSTRGTPATRQN